ncbi:hypothetical protein C1J01_04820 [Nonomuraea aridisoli]|uniref:Uncharacterized protein n=1 Tax=Nonomuraea aridisoli TaxID=2070368 RepID=A0A2W2G5C1_9ACTN|nr:hypothetical protein C1J01_04820 [Nonomuraea aridisoli]
MYEGFLQVAVADAAAGTTPAIVAVATADATASILPAPRRRFAVPFSRSCMEPTAFLLIGNVVGDKTGASVRS